MKRLFKNLVFAAAFIAVFVGYFIFMVTRAPSTVGRPVEIEIPKGLNVDQIIKILADSELLEHPRYFKTLTIVLGKSEHLQAGSYSIPRNTSIYRLVKILSESNAGFTVSVTIPEGYNLKNIQELLSNELGRQVSLSQFKIGDFQERFAVLKGAELSASLEGYLFPDTYRFGKYGTDAEIVEHMLSTFNEKFTKDFQDEIKKQGKSLNDIVTMASIVEKEIPMSRDSERKIASGVLWKRIDEGVPLQVDATIVYATGKEGKKVLLEDLKINSPYNTYINRGLPPGPIASPGVSAIEAAIYPQSSPYWYYISKPTGETVFSKTLEEHNIAVNKYLR